MIPVLVPVRADHGHRDRLWNHLRTRYWGNLPKYRVVVGRSPEGPFNRSAAVNHAAQLAGDWDVAVIADNDSWVPPKQLNQAVMIATYSGSLVAAFDHVVELTPQYTDIALAGGTAEPEPLRVRTRDLETQSSMLVIPRTLWEAIPGMDEKFVGYGGEDNALWKACELLARCERITGPVYHLWHPPAVRNRRDPNYRRNQARWRRYAGAQTVDQLRAAQR